MSKKNTNHGDDNLVAPIEIQNENFPNSKLIRLVQMDGYLQYHFEDGTAGSARLEEDLKYLTSKWTNQQDN